LDLNVLLVRKQTKVVIEFERIWLVTAFAKSRFYNLAFFDEATFFTVALLTSESGFFHFRDYVRAADNNTS
jgi:hypothetical protein